MNRVGKSQQILLTKGQRDIFNNSQGLKQIQEKPQGLKCNNELILKNIRPQKIEHKIKEKKNLRTLGSPFGVELLGKEENFVAANSL